MRQGAAAFLFGMLMLHRLPVLPPVWLVVVAVAGALTAARCSGYARIALWLVLGFAWAFAHAWSVQSQRLPEALAGVDLVAEGTVVSLPEVGPRATRFRLAIETLSRAGEPVASPGLAKLSWYGRPPALRPGDVWRLHVRLKPPHGYRNPGGFDYERWLYREGIGATGYVRNEAGNRRLTRTVFNPGAWVNYWRHRLRARMAPYLGEGPGGALLPALAIGVRDDIEREQWDVLNRTGTTHLMAISGLHIGLVAGAGFWLLRFLWGRCPPLARRWPAPKAGAVGALVLAAVYALLAGFSIPTRRALLMLGVVLGARLLQRRITPTWTLAVALLGVLLTDPVAVLSGGFWLSFAAVAVIAVGVVGRAPGVRWYQWGRVQTVVALGLLPLTVFLFQRASLIAPLANLIAVPWVSLMVVPAALGGASLLVVAEPVGADLLQLAQALLNGLWLLLASMAEWPFAQWVQHTPPLWALLTAGLGVVLMAGPRGIPGRWLAPILLLPLLWNSPPEPPAGGVWVSVLDVGQGLAVVVRTREHTLVYDTGPQYGDFDTGRAVVVPFLRASGVGRVDRLVISHGDNDHIGGARSVLAMTRVDEVVTGVPDALSGRHCLRGQHWQWDGVAFEFLYPPRPGFSGNEGSCVLRIAAGGTEILITGDIEERGEAHLVAHEGDSLEAVVLVAPHHGSTSSSTPSFVAAVQPDYVVFPAGYRNRYGFPRPEIIRRYRAAGAQLLTSGYEGAITVRVGPDGAIRRLSRYRRTHRRHWHAPAVPATR